MSTIMGKIAHLCREKGLRMTHQRRVIVRVLEEAHDHPDVEELHRRAQAQDSAISLATLYRTVRLLEEAGILDKHEFGGGRARYEQACEGKEHHDHLVDVRNGRVIEFSNQAIEDLQHKIAEELGYRLIGHRLELFAVPLDAKARHRR